MPSCIAFRTQHWGGGALPNPAIKLLGYADNRLSSFTTFRTGFHAVSVSHPKSLPIPPYWLFYPIQTPMPHSPNIHLCRGSGEGGVEVGWMCSGFLDMYRVHLGMTPAERWIGSSRRPRLRGTTAPFVRASHPIIPKPGSRPGAALLPPLHKDCGSSAQASQKGCSVWLPDEVWACELLKQLHVFNSTGFRACAKMVGISPGRAKFHSPGCEPWVFAIYPHPAPSPGRATQEPVE